MSRAFADPLRFDPRGRTAEVGPDEHLRDLIEAVLFTSPGERVNRPEFGSGLLQLVFAPNSPEVAATVCLLAQGALQRWLGDRIEVAEVEVEVEPDRGTLRVTVRYASRQSGAVRVDRFERGGP
jgi:phage baseplate assembly protein W